MDMGFVQVSFSLVRRYGGMVLLVGGLAGYGALLAVGLATGWTLPYPQSFAMLVLCALPAAGVAWMFLQAGAAEIAAEGDDR